MISGFAVNSNLIECCLFNFQITKHFDFSIKFQVYWTGRCNLHYNCLLLQYQRLCQVSRAQHCTMQCWLPVAEKGSALKSLTPSQKLQEGQQKGPMSNTELSGLKEAFGQKCDHRTVLLTWTGHALPNQLRSPFIFFNSIFHYWISITNSFPFGNTEFSLTVTYRIQKIFSHSDFLRRCWCSKYLQMILMYLWWRNSKQGICQDTDLS